VRPRNVRFTPESGHRNRPAYYLRRPRSGGPRRRTWNKTSSSGICSLKASAQYGGGNEALTIDSRNCSRVNRRRHKRRGPKLSVVRALQERRSKLWLHNISTMPGLVEWGSRLLPAEYAIRASTWAASPEQGSKALFVLTTTPSAPGSAA